jgi:protein-S-isoprenylcysteine O-methyltransferase Ste14
MNPLAAKIIYLLGYWIANFVIRTPHIKARHRQKLKDDHKTPADKTLFVMVGLGGFVVPLVYVFTPWLAMADYSLPLPIGIAGTVVLIAGDWLFWRSHRDLGENWSPLLEIRQGHRLVTHGIYQRIRHPMYAALWLLVIAQAMILPNYIAGFSGVIPFAALYFHRVGREEIMMRSLFGEAYEEHVRQTGRLLPKLQVRSSHP